MSRFSRDNYTVRSNKGSNTNQKR